VQPDERVCGGEPEQGNHPLGSVTRAQRIQELWICPASSASRPDLYALVLSGPGDVPLTELRFRCSQCGTDRTDYVVTSRDSPKPW
jgi:rubredoxin